MLSNGIYALPFSTYNTTHFKLPQHPLIFVIFQGSHEALMLSNGIYASMVRADAKKFEVNSEHVAAVAAVDSINGSISEVL